ncbi:phage protein [Bifidobacterium cuniculi]|uniref:Phage protein n=2 Tax=Bifidobacterium cuniculi TaxID=1688 RepID=A0A087AFH7_9BIFI|nr:phage protein [Bifidobacterium cuniculi]
MGWFAVWWIESFCVIGSPPVETEPMVFTPEYAEFLVNCYALDRHGRRLFDRVFLSRPKGSNKSGLAGLIALFESLAPCRFDHWAEAGESYMFLGRTYRYQAGEPVGRLIQGSRVALAANSEDQTGNVYDVIYVNCTDGPLAQLRGVGMDVGQTRIILPEECGGGEIRPATSGAASRDGGLQTWIELDESHLFQGRAKGMARTLIRNGSKRKRDAEPWVLETTTMYQPGLNSLAEDTYRTAWSIAEGKTKHDQRTLFDHRYAVLSVDDIADEKKLTHALMESHGSVALSKDGKDHLILPDGRITTVVPGTGRDEYGNSLATPGVEPGPSKYGWVDLDGPKNLILNAGTDPAEAIRYYLNSLTSAADAWVPESDIQTHLFGRELYDQAADARAVMDVWKQVIKPDEEITLGFDGSVSDDSTALVGCRVRDGLLFLVKLLAKPDGAENAHWTVDRDAFDGAVRYMMEHYNVVGMFADTAFWEPYIAAWEQDYEGQLRVSPRGNRGKIRFPMNGFQRDVYDTLVTMETNFKYEWKPVARHAEPIRQQIALLADPRLVDHFRNARRREKRFGYLVFKETPNSPNKIDAMMAGLLAYAARNKYLADGEEEEVLYRPIRVYG